MHLKIGIFKHENWPYSNECSIFGLAPSKKCSHPGIESEILGEILHRANITYELSFFKVLGFFNQSWNGGFGQILNRDIDTMGMTVMITDLRSRYFDFTYPIGYINYVFMYKIVDDSFVTHLKALFTPFQLNLWLTLIFTCLILLITWFATAKPNSVSEIFSLCWKACLKIFMQIERKIFYLLQCLF